MTEFYVDRAAGGAGTGLSPTDAHTNLNSLTQGTSVQFGDNVWVRRSHFELMVDGANRYGANGTFNPYSHAYVNVVGWPNSGEAFYLERPAAGISASWDSDVGLVGFDAPTLISSRATLPSFTLKEGTFFTNFCISNSVSFLPQITIAFGSWKPSGRRMSIGKLYLRNAVFQVGQTELADLDEVVVCASIGGLSSPIVSLKNARKVTLVGSTFAQVALQMPITYIAELEILSSSIGILARQNTVSAPELGHIGKIYGNQPTVFLDNPAQDLEGQSTNTNYAPLHVGDWFGLGHRRFGSRGRPNLYAASSAMAAHSAAPALCIFPSSQSAGTGEGQFATDDGWTGVAAHVVNVTSGVPFVARWHMYSRNCGSMDMRRIGGISLSGRGGNRVLASVANGLLKVGSVGLWSGNSISAGSAWLMQATFTPTETNTAFLTGFAPGYSAAMSGVLFVSPFFEVGSA